ncbi:TIGR04283 family arsenosugar biosynthesis glycosyltransferase [Terrisporobacter sp.]|uniref:TIGR04283 family arsenosugar biosynthesis glycosyltransferase n=1 Tax=Terrisporobacter sp. TaxID=1965305 RepID=UPI00261D1E2D|nr:TIGR04283 family arsenosugar biosynthesis glycosyltransferase [Terrisporobacter sp.]
MVSIIIPTYNEEKNIKELQENLSRLKGNFEVIFCDGGSSDSTTKLIDEKYLLLNSPKGRANQMNHGSNYAKGEILFFLHCDSIIEEDVILKIQDTVDSNYNVGCLKIEFDNPIIWMKICAYMSNLRASKRKIAFGDQGIFIKKQLFDEIGGMPNLPIMEDFEFSLRLKRKKYYIKQIDSKIITSSRRYMNKGIFNTMYQMKKLQFQYLCGRDIDKINKEYRDIR